MGFRAAGYTRVAGCAEMRIEVSSKGPREVGIRGVGWRIAPFLMHDSTAVSHFICGASVKLYLLMVMLFRWHISLYITWASISLLVRIVLVPPPHVLSLHLLYIFISLLFISIHPSFLSCTHPPPTFSFSLVLYIFFSLFFFLESCVFYSE